MSDGLLSPAAMHISLGAAHSGPNGWLIGGIALFIAVIVALAAYRAAPRFAVRDYRRRAYSRGDESRSEGLEHAQPLENEASGEGPRSERDLLRGLQRQLDPPPPQDN